MAIPDIHQAHYDYPVHHTTKPSASTRRHLKHHDNRQKEEFLMISLQFLKGCCVGQKVAAVSRTALEKHVAGVLFLGLDH